MTSIKRNSIWFSSLIQDLIIEGYTIPELAEQWNVNAVYLCQLYKPIKVNQIPVMKELDKAFDEEKSFYYDNLKANN